MADTEALQKQLFAEMKGRIKEDDSSVPMKDGPLPMAPSTSPAASSRIISASPAEGGERQVILDGDKEAEGKDYLRLAGMASSSDHTLGVWGYDDKGSEFFTLRVRNLTTGEDMSDILENTGGGGAWDAEGKSFFYTLQDENHRPSKIFHHILGQPQSADRLVYEETDPGMFMGVGGSRLDDFIYIDIHDHDTTEYRLLSTKDLLAEPKLVVAREPGMQ